MSIEGSDNLKLMGRFEKIKFDFENKTFVKYETKRGIFRETKGRVKTSSGVRFGE